MTAAGGGWEALYSAATALHALWDGFLGWGGFHLEPAKADYAPNFFGMAQFLSTLALLVVVFNVADFRYRYRLAVRKRNVRTLGIVTSGIIAAVMLIAEFWFNNALPIPHILNNYGNIGVALAAVFLLLVLYVVSACFLTSAKFHRRNARKFFEATNLYIHQGNKDRMQAIAEELMGTIGDIFEAASQIPSGQPTKPPPEHQAIAHDLLLTIADQRFCALIVDRVPGFALRSFLLATKYPSAPFAHFARNVGEAFITNTGSAFYQEDSGFYSGYFGYAKPVTSIVFGSYALVERCAKSHASPLDLHYALVPRLDPMQIEGFTRAGLAFFCSYLNESHARAHSFALARLLGAYKSASSGIYRLNGTAGDWSTPEYERLSSVMDFIHEAIKALEKSKWVPRHRKPGKETYRDVFDALAELIWDIIRCADIAVVDGAA